MRFGDVVNVISRRWWLVVGFGLVLGLAAFGVTAARSGEYSTTATLELTPRNTASRMLGAEPVPSTAEDGYQETQLNIMRLQPVVTKALKSLDSTMTTTEVLARAKFARVGQSNLLTVTYTDRDPKLAATMANGLAKSYVEWSRAAQKARYDTAITQLRDELYAVKYQMTLARHAYGGNDKEQAKFDLTQASNQYTALNDALNKLAANKQTAMGDAVLVAPAVPGEMVATRSPWLNGLLGLIVGLALGVLVAFMLRGNDGQPSDKDSRSAGEV